MVTLIADVWSRYSARLLAGISNDRKEPFPFSSATLLTFETTNTVDSFNIGSSLKIYTKANDVVYNTFPIILEEVKHFFLFIRLRI